MKKLLLGLALLSINVCIIGAAGSADEKREAEESSGGTDELFRQQADSWAQEALKGLTDLEQLVLMNVASHVLIWVEETEVLHKNRQKRTKGNVFKSMVPKVKELKNEKLTKLVQELEKEMSEIKLGEVKKIDMLSHKFLALERNSKIPDAFKVQILFARKLHT